MKNNIYIFMLLLATLIVASSCEKEIDLDLPKANDKIVVEGVIESSEYPWVFLSRSHYFLEGIDFGGMSIQGGDIKGVLTTLNKYMVLPPVIKIMGQEIVLADNGIETPNLLITVTDGTVIDTLQFEINMQAFTSGNFVYPPVKFVGKKFKGQKLGKYDLTIKYGDQTFTATTTIPNYAESTFSDFKFSQDDPKNDTLGFVYVTIDDKASEANYYRFSTKRIGKDSIFVNASGPGRIINDRMFNGTKMPLPIMRGRTSNAEENEKEGEEEHMHFKKGDKVLLKCMMLDKEHYRFWVTAFRSGSNFMGEPAKVESNIKGGALGIWGGYGCVYKQIDCIKYE